MINTSEMAVCIVVLLPGVSGKRSALWRAALRARRCASISPSPIGTTREEIPYELFFTALPQDAFTPADIVDLYLHRGAFETVLCDEDKEQDPDRWCCHTTCGQEAWQILSQWF